MRFFRGFPKTAVAGATWPALLFPALLFAALALVPKSALAEYRLQSGDAVEVSVTGVPDLRQRAPIGVDGKITLSLVGQINVSGLSVSQARAEIARNLANKLYRQSTPDGREIPHLILGDEIVVTVVEYRPVYMKGDVARPGEYPFRPGITVRQAVAVAGGYDLMRLGAGNPLLQTADLRSENDTLWLDFAREQARVWRLRTELGEPGVEDTVAKAPIPAAVGERLIRAETEQLKARLADREKDKALLQEAISKAGLQLGVLAEKKKRDEEGHKADLADFEKVRELFQKNLTSTVRLSEARRAALLSSDQLLQTIIEMSNIERQRGDYARQLEKIDSLSRIEDLRELQDANLHLAQIAAHLKSTAEKLTYTGLLQSQLVRGAGRRPDITVYRRGADGPQRLAATEDLELAPGDVVDVMMQIESLAEVPTAELPTPSKKVR